MTSQLSAGVELWGGVECTLNRVGDTYFDQLAMSGHDTRNDDLGLFRELGFSALRFPVLWERCAPADLAAADWRWSDDRLAYMRDLGLKVIAGLVHHGSGPRHTSLLDPAFPAKLAAYAGAVAARYPWIDAYTPVNEPLTTARFSGLYGLWYPHLRGDSPFLRMLYHQCLATKRAMEAIRKVAPSARLVQPEDLGQTFSTPLLAYQAAMENDRRWLSFDLLTGTIARGHRLWDYCRAHGLTEAELAVFQDEPCRPDIVGVNHYLTSNRFLDERFERYPVRYHGSNGRHRYADVEAVRVGAEPVAGHAELLTEAWERYRIPVAITEAHLGCSRDEQLRWLDEVRRTADALRRTGVDIRAVTVWSLLGSYEWNSLVTRRQGHYEPGAFDMRSGNPRPTALARYVRAVTRSEAPDHPVLDVPGWWRRPERLLYPPVDLGVGTQARPSLLSWTPQPRELVIIGAGRLGRAFSFLCEQRGLPCRLLDRADFDACDPVAVGELLGQLRPWAVINAAGFVGVDAAETDVEACLRLNTLAPAALAAACAARGARFVSFSSALVFDGMRREPYIESNATAPLSVYGRSKVEAELAVLTADPQALVVRAGTFFGPWDEHNFVTTALRRLARGEVVRAADDQTISPTYLPDLAQASLDLLVDGERGLWHLANDGVSTWAELARRAAEAHGLRTGVIEAVATLSLGQAARRPAFSALGSARGGVLPSLDRALERYARECRVII